MSQYKRPPAIFYLKYRTNRVMWIHNQNIASNDRDVALQILKNNIVNKVYYTESYFMFLSDPDAINLTNPTSDDRLYCSQLVYTTYKQLLKSSVVYWFFVYPVTPNDLAEFALDNNMVISDYSGVMGDVMYNFDTISSKFGRVDNINDEDWWGITFFEPDKKYILETSGDNGSNTDTALYLYKVYRKCPTCPVKSFTQVDKNDDGGGDYGRFSKIEFTAPSDVSQYEYYVMVRGLQSNTGAYKLTIREAGSGSNNFGLANVITVLRVLSGLQPSNPMGSDAIIDGKIDLKDAIYILQSVAGLRGTSSPTTPPAAPTVTATPGDGQVTLSWNAVNGAVSYNVYKFDSFWGWLLYQNNIGYSYTFNSLTNGYTYSFAVTAVNSNGESSKAEISVAPQATVTVPNPPKTVNAVFVNNQITISWDAVMGATSYNLWHKTSSSTSVWSNEVVSTTSKTGNITVSLPNPVIFYYKVQAVNSAGTSGYSDEASVSVHIPPRAPTNVKTVVANNQLTISWDVALGATSYILWLRTSTSAWANEVVSTIVPVKGCN